MNNNVVSLALLSVSHEDLAFSIRLVLLTTVSLEKVRERRKCCAIDIEPLASVVARVMSVGLGIAASYQAASAATTSTSTLP